MNEKLLEKKLIKSGIPKNVAAKMSLRLFKLGVKRSKYKRNENWGKLKQIPKFKKLSKKAKIAERKMKKTLKRKRYQKN